MGNKAYLPISTPLQTYNEAKTTCEAKGGFLPIVKSMKDFENHVFAHWLDEGKALFFDIFIGVCFFYHFQPFLVSTAQYWTSLKQSNNPQSCLNAACNAQDIRWADDSKFVYEDLNKAIAGRATETCFAINPYTVLPSLGTFAGINCDTKVRVICEFACT